MYCNFSNYVYGTVLIIINKLNNHFTGTYVVVASIYITAICYYIIIIEYRKENKDVCNHWLLQNAKVSNPHQIKNSEIKTCGTVEFLDGMRRDLVVPLLVTLI